MEPKKLTKNILLVVIVSVMVFLITSFNSSKPSKEYSEDTRVNAVNILLDIEDIDYKVLNHLEDYERKQDNPFISIENSIVAGNFIKAKILMEDLSNKILSSDLPKDIKDNLKEIADYRIKYYDDEINLFSDNSSKVDDVVSHFKNEWPEEQAIMLFSKIFNSPEDLETLLASEREKRKN